MPKFERYTAIIPSNLKAEVVDFCNTDTRGFTKKKLQEIIIRDGLESQKEKREKNG